MSNKRMLKRRKKKKVKNIQSPQVAQQPRQMKKGQIPMVNIIAYAADLYGCYLYRILNFQNTLNEYSQRDIVFNYFSLNRFIREESFYKNTTVVIFQRPSTPTHVEMMKYLRQLSQKCGFLLVYELDDLLFEIPKYNYFANQFYIPQLESVKLNLQMANMCTTTTEYLKTRIGEFNNNVQIIENYLPNYMWNVNGHRIHQNNEKLKVLWAGSSTHFSEKSDEMDDLDTLYDVFFKTKDKYIWNFMGGVPERIKKDGNYKFVPWAQNHEYPRVLQNLDIDVGIGSLIENNFNKAKSNIKRKEYLSAGFAGLYSKFSGCPYENATKTFQWDSAKDLKEKLEDLEDPEERQKVYDAELKSLEGNLYIEDQTQKIVNFWKRNLRIK